MGVTIHYGGNIGLRKIPALGQFLVKLSEAQGFEYKLVSSRHAKGILVRVEPDCDDLRFVFDRAGYFRQFTKTQFGGLKANIKVLVVLRVVKERFIPNMDVRDEGGFWGTGDFEKLRETFTDIAVGLDVIAEKLSENKSTQ